MAEQPETTPDVDLKTAEQEMWLQANAEAKKKASEYEDQLLRLRAEFDNFRKRVDREKAEARTWGKQDVLMELVSLVDVFEQAMAQAHSAKDLKQVVQGVDMLHKSFSKFLKDEGLEPIDAVGKPFDPLTAEAMEQVEVEADQVGTVLAEIQKGYKFQNLILRPSRVRVGVAKKSEDKKA